MKKEVLVGGLASLILVLVVSWFLVQEDARTFSLRQEQALALSAQDLESRFFTRHRQELEWLAGRKPIRDYLTAGGEVPSNLPFILQSARGLLDLDVVYLVSREGRIVASSDSAYLGADLKFRPYFQKGMQGVPSYALAIGVVTQSKGLYAAVPVWDGDRVVGVAAFRTAATQLDRYLADSTGLFLLGPDGQAFAASDPQARDTSGWVWTDSGQVRVGHADYQVRRLALDVVPGFSLVSLRSKTWPWEVLLVTNLILVLLVFTGFSIGHQFRLTRERRAEAQERQQRETLLANLLEGIAVLDGSARLVWANPAFLRLAQMESGDPPPVLAELWDSPAPGPWKEVLEGKRDGVVFESVLKGRQGGWTPVLAGFASAGGQYLLSVLDRSEHHRSDQLLRQSQKLTVLGQLSGGVAHDLNNMLGVLMGMTDLLKMTLPEQDPLQESVDLMLTTLTRAASLADKMLNFARQTPMVRVPLDVTALLRELRFLARTALTEDIQAVFEAPTHPVLIRGDENLLLSALLNLILNAAEAADNRGEVRVTGRETGDGQFEILVEDEGRGMDRATLNRIFEPFFSTKHEKKGTGLGLSLVRRTILEHQGTIDVRSQPGVGTEVRIRLPILIAEASAAGEGQISSGRRS